MNITNYLYKCNMAGELLFFGTILEHFGKLKMSLNFEPANHNILYQIHVH